MATTNDFLPYALANGANVVTQITWLGDALRLSGFVPGVADAAQANKAWRQAAVVASQVAQFMSDTLGEDVLDNGNLATFLDQLKRAIGATAGAARIVTASTPLVMALSDRFVALDRTVGVTPTAVTLPTLPDAAAGTLCGVEDMSNNFDLFPVTVSPPAGTISRQANIVLNVPGRAGYFRWYGANRWAIAS